MQGPEGHSFIAHKKSVEVEEESSFGFLIKLLAILWRIMGFFILYTFCESQKSLLIVINVGKA